MPRFDARVCSTRPICAQIKHKELQLYASTPPRLRARAAGANHTDRNAGEMWVAVQRREGGDLESGEAKKDPPCLAGRAVSDGR